MTKLRKRYHDDVSPLPLDNAAVHIAELAKMAKEARKRKNNAQAAKYIEQIAKRLQCY